MKRIFLFFFLITSFYLFAQQPPVKYTWNGKELPHNEWRDSMKVFYLKYCDSLNKKLPDSVIR